MNIIVGENESGKSTILEALNIVLNQQYKNSDKYIIKDLINVDSIKDFQEDRKVENLPKIEIEVELNIKNDDKTSEMLFGENNHYKKEKFGISFLCEFDEDFTTELIDSIEKGEIPYEYYTMTWKTFEGSSYNSMKKYVKSIFIDTSNSDTNNSFNYYNKNLFHSKYNENDKLRIKNDFRNKINEIMKDINIGELDEGTQFGVNGKKVIFEKVISVFEENIPLENKGKGQENIIKTEIALKKQKERDDIDIVMIEEPENHLSSSNLLKMLKNIEGKMDQCQMIITTHNNMIASRLKLNNVLWILKNESNSLNNIDEDTSEFFSKATNNNFLQLLLSEKVILVEGPTEYILLPKIYEKEHNKTLEEDKISIISCNGISYKRYLTIAENTNKKVAVLTDNDEKQGNIDYMKAFNESHEKQRVFMDEDIKKWTWEVCLYNKNKELMKRFIKVQEGAKYKIKGREFDAQLGKMLNNKVDTAYQLLKSNKIDELEIPNYILEALQWLKQ
jgi:predicted ATP-dependent endonuclease of OLD family